MDTLLGTLRVILVGLLWISATSAQQVLRWGADPSGGAPYVYADPANPNRYIGFEKEMVDALAAAMGRKPEFVPTDWESIVSTLQRGSFDIVVNGLEPTTDRAQLILFSKPYYVFEQQLTVRKDEDRIHSIADCRSLRLLVGTLGNTAASRYMQKEGIPFRGYPDPVAAYRDLELKRIDGVLMDVPMELYYARSNPALRPAGAPFLRGTYNVGLRKGDEALKAQIDAAIDKIIRDGKLESILRKWNLWNDAQALARCSLRSCSACRWLSGNRKDRARFKGSAQSTLNSFAARRCWCNCCFSISDCRRLASRCPVG